MIEAKLSHSAQSLLRSMKNGLTVLVRATTGRATYSLPGHGEHDCTESLKESLKNNLVEIEKIDKEVGWVTYIGKPLVDELSND